MSSTASGFVNTTARQNRVTLRKTLISCLGLTGALVLAIVLMSLIGSESTARTSFVVRTCFVRHKRVRVESRSVRHSLSNSFAENSFGCGRRWLTRHCGRRLSGTAAKPTRRALPARYFKRCCRGNDDRARVFWRERMDQTAARVYRRIACHVRCLSIGAWARRRDPGTFDTRRGDRHDVSVIGDRLCDDFDGRDEDSFVHVLAAWRSFRHE